MAVDPADAALAAVVAYCGWHIAPSQSVELTLDGTGSRLLLLPSLHVTDVASVTVAGELVDPATYDWSEAGMLELRCGYFPRRFRSVVVAFTHGYDAMPDDVQTVIDQLADSGLGPQAVQVGQVRVSLDRGNGEAGIVSASSVLDRYRLPSRP